LALNMTKLTHPRGGPARFLRQFTDFAMRAGGDHRGTRTIVLALVAGLIAFETILALSAGALGVPGLFLIRFANDAGGEATQHQARSKGGESVIAKLEAATEPSHQTEAAQPLSPVAPEGVPRLDGLADIPLTPWVRDEAKPDKPRAFAATSAGREVLPWDAVEPVPYPSEDSEDSNGDVTASLPAAALATPRVSAAPLALPASGEVETWVKAKATEVKGEDRARPLFHFEFWLEPPEELKRRLAAVAYEFNTPAVMPQSQSSSEQNTGFRVSAGGLTCADKVTVTLRFRDGRSQQVAVDGCKLVSKDAA
jgi:hypothetical protein